MVEILNSDAPLGNRLRTREAQERSEAGRSLSAELEREIEGEVRFDGGSRALYASDLSIYRQVPVGVVIPRTVDDVIATVAACRRHDVPVLGRGAATSLKYGRYSANSDIAPVVRCPVRHGFPLLFSSPTSKWALRLLWLPHLPIPAMIAVRITRSPS